MSKLLEMREKIKERLNGIDPSLIRYIPVIIRPAIQITAPTANNSFDYLQSGLSKFGGVPDLYGCAWPNFREEAMIFIGQVNLIEIQKYDEENTFPHQGLLSFFLSKEAINGSVEDPESCLVRYEPNPLNSEPTDPPPHSLEAAYIIPQRKMSFKERIHPSGIAFRPGLSGEEFIDIESIVGMDWWKENVESNLSEDDFAPPFLLGTTILAGQQFVNAESTDEVPLLTIGGMSGNIKFPFFNGNSIHAFSFIIKKKDLANANFSEVRLSYDIS